MNREDSSKSIQEDPASSIKKVGIERLLYSGCHIRKILKVDNDKDMSIRRSPVALAGVVGAKGFLSMKRYGVSTVHP